MDTTDTVRIMIITDTGCEAACALEIQRLLPNSTPQTVHATLVEMDGSVMDAALLCYRLQTARRVLLRCAPRVKTVDEVSGLVFDPAIRDAITYEGATCKAEGDILGMDMKTGMPNIRMPIAQELVEEVGGWAHDALKLPVDLKRPSIIVYAIATPGAIDIGVDMAGFSLSKREYRIMLSSRSIKATVAASSAIYAESSDESPKRGKTGGVLLDPFVDDGTLCIEAALLRTRTSPRKFLPMSAFAFTRFPVFTTMDWNAWKREQDSAQDQTKNDSERRIIAYAGSMREMKAVRTNSKLAGVDDHILSTKVDLDWIDLKRDEKSIDNIRTSPVTSGKSLAPAAAAKLQDALFNQAAYILKKNGRISCLTDKPDELMVPSEKHGFACAIKHDMLMGKRKMQLIVFAKHKA
ncbi:TPA: hypothetical protein HA251_05540 [Candidatus Woesearchaeota archaeon]|nr:hypothetical protein [Candidatus Woesearchaeota archaeon]